MIKIAARIFVTLLFGVSAPAQTRDATGPNLSKPYWLKYSLVFYPNHTPVVSPRNIRFAAEGAAVQERSGAIELRGRKVKIYSVRREKGYARVTFRLWPESYETGTLYEVLLMSDTRSNFRKSFALLYSGAKVPPEYPCDIFPKTKKQVIRCLGFPMLVTRDGDAEEFHYILEFLGPNHNRVRGFHVDDHKRQRYQRGRVHLTARQLSNDA